MSTGSGRTMLAAYIDSTGPASAIRTGMLPIPELGPTEIRAKTIAVAVNHVDTFVRSGAYVTPLPRPFIVGRDAVGRIDAVGDNVANFRIGDLVWCNSLGYGGRQGPTAEYFTASADRVRLMADRHDPFVTAALLHPLGTCYLGLVSKAGVGPGDVVHIGHASSAVGTVAIQIAKAWGATVVASCRAFDTDWCRGLGADHVVEIGAETPVDEALTEWTRATGRRVSIHWDTSGSIDYEAILPCLAVGSRVLVSAGIRQGAVFPQGRYYTNDTSLLGFAISNAGTSLLAAVTDGVAQVLGSLDLTIRIGSIGQLDDVAEAHRTLEGEIGAQPVTGRIVISLENTTTRSAPEEPATT